MRKEPLFGAIELGGTKTVVAIGKSDGTVRDQISLPTIAPEELVAQIGTYFAAQVGRWGPLAALGVGAFGPIVIDPEVPDYGQLLATNKPGWSGFALAAALHSACGMVPHIVTDVAAAGIGEARLGALRGCRTGIYLTVGTGVGGAIIVGGQPLPALLHPEMGHIALKRLAGDDARSACRFHESCAEGLASGPAIIARFGHSLSHFDPSGPEYNLVADYLGQLCANLVFAISPERIVIGGGVGKAPRLAKVVQAAMLQHLSGYAPAQVAAEGFVCSPQLDQCAGIAGALCLAGQTQVGRIAALRQE